MSAETRYTILIVDDNPNNIFTLQHLLEAHLDAEIIEANSGLEALETISQRQDIDLIILDIQMPGMNGFEVAELVRQRKKYQDIPIIFLTAVYKSEKFKSQGLAGGAIDYLTKPIDNDTLVNRIKAYLGVLEKEREQNRHLQELNARLQEEIAERKQAEEAHRESEEKYRRLFEGAHDSIFIIDSATRQFLDANQNAARRLGYSRGELLELGLNDINLPMSREKNEGIIKKLLEKGSVIFEHIHICKDGREIPVEISSQTIEYNGRKAWQSIARDITERRLAEKELRKAKQKAEAANKAKSEFLANMSHELRTPLNGILGYAQILKRGKRLTEQQQHGLSIIQKSGEHLLTLINDILDLSKIEARKFELEPAPFHLLNSLNVIVEMTRFRAHQKGLEFSYEKSAELPRAIYSDGKSLRQILLNLLGNAVKFTEHGSISLRVTRLSAPQDSQQSLRHRLRFEVEDSGIGIPAEQLGHIFSPFEQVQKKRFHTEGTGLGLSISRRLVQMMGSELHVESVLQQGSRFWFELDVSESQEFEGGKERQQRRITGYDAEKPLSILLVDDKAHNRAVVRDLLTSVGLHIIEAENGRDALEKIRTLRPDLIIMDLVMPLMDGFEATHELRKDPQFETLPILALSASAFKEHKEASLKAGCDDFLAKPFSEHDLFEIIGRHLALEWRYDQVVESQDEALIDETITPPPLAILRNLNEMASIGDILGIRDALKELEPQHPESDAFFAKLRQLAAELRLLEIQEYLRCYLKVRMSPDNI